MRHVALLLLAGLALGGCSIRRDRFTETRALIANQCGSCHVVPGVTGANGNVGPSLEGIGTRQVIAGYFPNTRANLVRWVAHPQAMLPNNAMPETHLTPEQANQVADYLYTLDR
ncbi:c-type cytochrome [Sphingomonas ginkgonis]|uniref:C-type cytochrome n=1 Tax=Sphingomonas ginkgonis TaxID=2315330 RepID=A0A3R9Z6U0_9SPHN|nr:c-type cytochrome [Sphingomonas ginkgonis]RST31238.1 c-type cytochrome [Sphingomonas ginkgonis]